MARERMILLKRTTLALLGAPLLALLAGCPADTAAPAAAPGKVAANATAPPVPQVVAAQQQAVQQSATNQHEQKVKNLITRAEASFNSGVKNYNANRLDAARQDFDYAVDAMLSSGMDLKGDPDLSDEFERLLGAINSLEMLALKQGNGFSPKVEDAPLQNAEEMTFPPNPELVAELKSELNTTSDLPLIINDQVAGYINVFSQSSSFRAHMAASMQRLGKYRTLIQNVLKEEGVPQDLIYLAVAESGFQPQALNVRSGAGGMWQFMTYTGPEYGLTRNAYFDYRFDPEKSTRAYARLIKSYHALFNDWYLAMIAYDWGPGNIQKIVSRTGYSDFWELYRRASMPAETHAYVPQILAAIIMAKNPEKYGLNKLPPSPPVIYETVTTDYAIDLKLVADLTDSTVAEIVGLNPALLRLSTPRDIPFDLHLPPGTRDLYLDRLKNVPEGNRQSWRFHIVKPGETIDTISSILHARAAEVAEFNDVTNTNPLEVGDELIVPIAAVSGGSAGQQRYTAKRGDTLVSIADRFGVTPDQIESWNHLASSHVTPGKNLYVAQPIHLAPATHTSFSHHGRSVTSNASRRSAARGRSGSRETSSISRKPAGGAHARALAHASGAGAKKPGKKSKR